MGNLNDGVFCSQLLKTGVDGRRYMRAAYDLFAGEGAEGGADPEAQLARVAELGPADEFYSLLYRGLYREAKGDADGAKAFMTEVRRVPQLNSLHPVLKYPITTQIVTNH